MLDDPRRLGEGLEVARREYVEERGKLADTSFASALEDRAALRGRCDDDCATVVGVTFARDEAVTLERAHEPAHRRRAHLLGAGKGAERGRAAEHEDRERREARSGETTRLVHTPNPAQHVYRRRMNTVGDVPGIE